MLTAKDFFDFRDTKFMINAIYPPEKQKFLEEKLHESAAAQGLSLQGGMIGHAGNLFTLDEALEYLKKMKLVQERILAEKPEA